MQNKSFTFITLALAILVLLFGRCKKEDPAPVNQNPTTTNTPIAVGFTWTPNGSPAVTADDAYFITAYNNIVATKNGNLSSVDITLENLSVGTHTVSPSNGITLEYNVGSITYKGQSGSVTITAKTGTLMSGNFTSILTGGTVTGISGQFTNIHEK